MVDSLVSLTLEKLEKVLRDEVATFVGVSKELKKLSSVLTTIKAVLVDAEKRGLRESSVKDWLQKLKYVAYDIDDILDEWTTEAFGSGGDEGDRSHSFNRKVRNFLSPPSCFDYVVFRRRIGNNIKNAWERLVEIETEKDRLHFKTDDAERPHERERETSSLVDISTTVGREDERKQLVKLLLNDVNEGSTVISIFIVGMPGVGKTTLAQLSYNDENTKEHFDIRMWVSVSKDFEVKQITKSIIESATGSSCDNLDLELLQNRLRKMLQAKRFLLVLDDVWSENREKWEKLTLAFQDSASGSRLLVTTRKENVAHAMGSVHIHKLGRLTDDDCWLLFRRRAFEHRTKEEISQLEEIGRQIVRKCGGVPLAAKTIGSVMSSRRTKGQWELVLENEIWKSSDVLEDILPTLLLSYHDLRPALKQCFTYFSVFPKDQEIEKDVIIKLWVAQGFICSEGSEDVEVIGGLYFDELLRHSLLQDAKMDSDGNIFRCKMHDLVHDLAQFVAGSDCLPVEIRKKASFDPNNVRHSFLFFSDEADHKADEMDSNSDILGILREAHKLRTLLLGTINMPCNLFRYWRCLRALDLSGSTIKKLPPKVGQMKHLRYLNLSHTNIAELPDGLGNCRKLQTLRLNGCDKLRKLPRWIPNMISLRHLELEGTSKLRYLPRGIGRLTGLRTLTYFIVGVGNEGCKCRELKQINHLQGSFLLKGLENIRSKEEAREAELSEKRNLHALSLHYHDDLAKLSDDEVKRMDDVLQSLQPHTNLKKFEIQNFPGSKLPNWIEDPFSSIVSVELLCCPNCERLPGLGKLPSLRNLVIKSMKKVRKVGGEFSGPDHNDRTGGGGVSFPKLETLIFWNMFNWEEWELIGGDGEVMPLLRILKIQYCKKLKALPHNLPPLLQKMKPKLSEGMCDLSSPQLT